MRTSSYVSLKDISESISYGFTASAITEEVGPHFLRITDIVPDYVDWSTVPYCRIGEKERIKFALKEGDIVIARTGATVGSAKLIRENIDAVFASYLVRFRIDNQKACQDFVGRLIESKIYRDFIKSRIIGSAQPNANAQVLGGFQFRLPSIEDQRRISDYLSNYDKMIKNNLLRIALIKKVGFQLYQEWFVRLRFPGYEYAKISNNTPKGWRSHALADICTIGRGASPRPIASFMGGHIPWFKIGDATSSESCFIFQTAEHVTDAGSKHSVFLKAGSLILSNSATCGIPYFTAVDGCIHDGWLYFSQPKYFSKEFLYCFLFFKREELINSVGDGSTQKNLNIAAVERLMVCLPQDTKLLSQFNESIKPIFSMILNLSAQNIKLRAARDLLLSRLMNGEIQL